MNTKTFLIIAALTLGGVTAAEAATPAKTTAAPANKAPVHHHMAAAKKVAPRKS